MSAAAAILTDEDGERVLRLSGTWTLGAAVPSLAPLEESRTAGAFARLRVDGRGVEAWDTALLVYVTRVRGWCEGRGVALDAAGLPEGARRLLDLAQAAPSRGGAASRPTERGRLRAIGLAALRARAGAEDALAFLGDVTAGVLRLLAGRARFRPADLGLALQQCGPRALGIVSLISFLVGTILAFVGAIQLRVFGAEVYVANLVGAGMVVEMGALMTGIILAGRTGAAFAAQLGTMQVNEEIDALRTLGIPPIDHLVLPRVVALGLMTPLLVIYADVLGIVGGAVVGATMLDTAPQLFFRQAADTITLWMCAQGLIKGTTFGALVALAGCLRGMQCGRSASAVGEAATSAVVTSIVWIVVADAVWTCLFMEIG